MVPYLQVTTSEKRAALEAAGEPWPDCECHGVPMKWGRYTALTDGGSWKCRVSERERSRRRYQQRKAAGVCHMCAAPAVTEVLCRACADKLADRMNTPYQKFRHQVAQSRYRRTRKAEEGFQPTGVGQAAIAARLIGRN